MKNSFFVITSQHKKEKVPGVNFLFPLKGFCVGFSNVYEVSELEKDVYLYVNRILDCESMSKFKALLPELEEKAKGIIFEDLGILEVLKERESSLETYFYATHAVCSSYTLNSYLEEMDTVILSPDVTEEETREIARKALRPIGIVLFANLPLMYSRRTLLTNYQKNFGLPENKQMEITEQIKKKKFLCVENEYGTVLYDDKYYDARVLLDEPNIQYYFLNLEFMGIEDYKTWFQEFLKGKEYNETTKCFLEEETIYRLPPRSVSND